IAALLLEQRRERRWRHLTEHLDLQVAARRLPDAAAAALARLRGELGGNAEPYSARVGDDAPTDCILPAARVRHQHGALVGIEDTGVLDALTLLERLHGRRRTIAPFTIGDAVEIAGPDQIGLDRDALWKRQR